LKKAFYRNLGFNVTASGQLRRDAFWFGEAQGRIVISATHENLETIAAKASSSNISFTLLGNVTAGNIFSK